MNMNKNNITFTGIKNLYVAHAICGERPNNLPKKVVKIACELTDDESGNDLTFYKNQLKKFDNFYKKNCIPDVDSNEVEMFAIRYVEPKTHKLIDPKKLRDCVESSFILNNCEFDNCRNNKSILPMYTYMAQLTNAILKNLDLSDKKRQYIEFFNKAVNDEAIKFLNL